MSNLLARCLFSRWAQAVWCPLRQHSQASIRSAGWNATERTGAGIVRAASDGIAINEGKAAHGSAGNAMCARNACPELIRHPGAFTPTGTAVQIAEIEDIAETGEIEDIAETGDIAEIAETGDIAGIVETEGTVETALITITGTVTATASIRAATTAIAIMAGGDMDQTIIGVIAKATGTDTVMDPAIQAIPTAIMAMPDLIARPIATAAVSPTGRTTGAITFRVIALEVIMDTTITP